MPALFVLTTPSFIQPLPEIVVDRKRELLDKELLVGRQVILLIKENHRLFIVDRFDAPVREGTIAVLDQEAIAGDSPGPFVPIFERLDIGNEQYG